MPNRNNDMDTFDVLAGMALIKFLFVLPFKILFFPFKILSFLSRK